MLILCSESLVYSSYKMLINSWLGNSCLDGIIMNYQTYFVTSLNLLKMFMDMAPDKRDHLYIPKVKNERGINKITYRGPVIWNQIQRAAINPLTSEAVFSKTLKQCIKMTLLWFSFSPFKNLYDSPLLIPICVVWQLAALMLWAKNCWLVIMIHVSQIHILVCV